MESNRQLKQAPNPNNAGLACLNVDIRHLIISNIGYPKACNQTSVSTFNVFVSAQSGSPFTDGIVNTGMPLFHSRLAMQV